MLPGLAAKSMSPAADAAIVSGGLRLIRCFARIVGQRRSEITPERFT
jgi:hypothetical protein